MIPFMFKHIAILVIFYQYIYAATSPREKHAQTRHISDEEKRLPLAEELGLEEY